MFAPFSKLRRSSENKSQLIKKTNDCDWLTLVQEKVLECSSHYFVLREDEGSKPASERHGQGAQRFSVLLQFYYDWVKMEKKMSSNVWQSILFLSVCCGDYSRRAFMTHALVSTRQQFERASKALNSSIEAFRNGMKIFESSKARSRSTTLPLQPCLSLAFKAGSCSQTLSLTARNEATWR